MKLSKTIQNPNLELFIREVIEATSQEWEIDPKNPPQMYGFYYETIMLRDEEIADEVKASRAEILARARAAKAAKAAAERDGRPVEASETVQATLPPPHLQSPQEQPSRPLPDPFPIQEDPVA